MRHAALLILFAFAAAAQPQRPVAPVDLSKVPQQPAQVLSIPVNSDLATSLEKWRRTITVTTTDPKTGITTTSPQYPDISALVFAALTGDGGVFARVVQDPRFMPTSVREAQDAAAKAAAAAKQATSSAIESSGPPKK